MRNDINDLTWYSRLAVWVGAVILLVQSLTGRALGVMTVVAVLMLSIGLLAFIIGLALKKTPREGGPSKP
jgi:hypothetical protein